MKAFKGFTKDMKCRDFQFEEGKTYEEETASLCNSGFHACENPLDCMTYYTPNDSVYHSVELDGVSDERREDSKVCAKRITVGARISIADMIKGAVQFVFEKVEKKSSTTGDWAHAATTGDWAHAATTGKNSISASIGIGGKAKASVGSWIVCAEYDGHFNLISVMSAKVDGEAIKADTWYMLKGGAFVEVDIDE